MYTTCLFCHGDLGRNEAIEAFPVGRRLAYDQARGRLWVVCRRCERWNLTPQEERWEAMEQAERLYRGTRLRAATDNVGLARLRDGTELVRIGSPLRPEFAAWRYGDQFGRRRRRQLLMVGGAVAVASVVVVAGPVLGLFSLGGFAQAPNLVNVANAARRSRTRIAIDDGPAKRQLHVSLIGAERARMVADRDGAVALVVSVFHGRRDFWTNSMLEKPDEVRLEGAAALLAASRILPRLNRTGGSKVDVRDAVDLVEQAGGAESLFARVAREERQFRGGWHATLNSRKPNAAGALSLLAPRARLALEMAVHEEQERAAMEGEVRALEAAWQQAEEIAGIADDLLLPNGVTERLDQLKARSTARAGAASNPSSDNGGASNS